VGPVGMLSPAQLITPYALEHFKGKHVRVYPAGDQTGIDAAGRWQKQLQDAGAQKIDFFKFSAFKGSDGQVVKDLCEFNRLKVGGGEFAESRILP